MATQADKTATAEAASIEVPAGFRYMARQPILDLNGRVYGYELLFRNGPELAFSGDGDFATRTMLDNTVAFGFEKLTGKLPAFVNCTLESLTKDLVHILPPSMSVLEILENIPPTPTLIETCRRLKVSGYRLALDDFVWNPQIEPLVELADFIKVDFAATTQREREALVKRLSNSAVAMVAEKVETQEQYKLACSEGFTLFQGYFFCHPELIQKRRIPANRLTQIAIIRLMRDESMDMRDVSDVVKRDPSLTYRLLRLVNSPLYSTWQEVRSIESALLIVGENVFRRLATVAITSELNADGSQELLRMAFVRARFCELAAESCEMDATEQYLLGMMSLLPAMLRMPMEEVAPSLPLREEVRQALLGAQISERCLLDWAISHEHGDWKACDAVVKMAGLDDEEVMQCYRAALMWAEAVLHFAL